MRLKLNRAAALTLTGTTVLATLNQVGGAADRCLVTTANEVKADDHWSANKSELEAKLKNSDLVKSNVGYLYPDMANTTKALSSNIEITQPIAGSTDEIPAFLEKTCFGAYTVSNSQFGTNLFGFKGTATINKNDIHKGKKILLGTITLANNKTEFSTKDTLTYTDNEQTHKNNTIAKFQNENIGQIYINTNDNRPYYTNQYRIYLQVTADKEYATNPDINFSFPNALGIINGEDNFQWMYKNTTPIEYINTSNRTYKIQFLPIRFGTLNSDLNYLSIPIQNDGVVLYENTRDNVDNSLIKDSNHNAQWKNDVAKVFKISGVNIPHSVDEYNSIRYMFYPIDANGNISTNRFSRDSNGGTLDKYGVFKAINDGNNKSAIDLLKDTKIGELRYSNTSSGLLVSYRYNPITYFHEFSDQQIIDMTKRSYLYNVQDPNHQQQILTNTTKFYKKLNNKLFDPIIRINSGDWDHTQPAMWNVIDATPNVNNPLYATVSYVPNGSTFNAELYRYAQVHYLDSNNKDTQVSNDSIMGTKNNVTNYTLNVPKGYILDTKSGKNKDGTQYKWSADKKSIAYTFNEDQKLNDANPINIYITHGTHNTNDNSGKSTRTIQYTGLPDNLKPKDNVQTVLFKRSGVTDDVSGETTYGDWQPQSGNGHYTAVPSPTFAGYKPDQEVIPDTAATPNKNETVTVNYSRTNQHAKLTVHDDTANTDLNDYAENSTGLYQDQINFKTAPSAIEQELKDKGYTIVSDSFKGTPTYNADDSKNNFVIHVTHKIVPVTPDHPKTPNDVIPDTKQHYPTGVNTNDLNKDVQRSIFYKYEDNSQAEPTVVQKAHFDRTVKVDAVTQKIVDNGTWATKDNYPEVATKSIDGYTPDKTKVDSATPSMTNNQDQTVVYHANDEDAAITYIDDTTGKVLKTDTQKAKYKQTIKFATDPNTQIQTYKDQGYVLVSSDWKDGSTYQTDPARNKFTVHLKHGTSTVTPDKPKKPTDIIPGTKQRYPTGVDTNDLNQPQQRQITYTYADSKKQASPTVTQKAAFHRTATVDNVTGKTTYTDWTTSDQYPEVKSPAIEGYTPNRQTVPATKPELNQKQDVAVAYNPNPEQVDVIAQDNTGKQLSKSTLHGNYNTDYTATTPVIKGYHLIKMPTNTHGTYKTHNDSIIYIYAPDSNSVPEQTDGTPKPDKSSYPNDLTPAKRSNKLPETGSINLQSELNSVANQITHTLTNLL